MPARSDTIALIPARYAATRFPGKLLAKLGGRTVIRRTWEATVDTGLFSRVIVVCDGPEIRDEIARHGGEVLVSARAHESGSDRIAEAAEQLDAQFIVNVQGDEPFTRREPLERLLEVFDGPDGAEIGVASLMQVLSGAAVEDPNFVKVAVDLRSNALMFSRSPIPYLRDPAAAVVRHEHIGIYAFRRPALLAFANLPPGPLEAAEKIECLRFLEHGIPIRMVPTDYMGVEIDTPEDLEQAERQL